MAPGMSDSATPLDRQVNNEGESAAHVQLSCPGYCDEPCKPGANQAEDVVSSNQWRQRLKHRLSHGTTQIEQVASCLDRALANPEQPSFLVVTGALGSGKTRLVVDALGPRVRDRDGYLIRGTHDMLGRLVPYTGLVAAFDDFARQVVQRGPTAIETMRLAVRKKADEGDRGSLIRMIPSLRCIIGDDSDETNSRASEATLHHFVFALFLFLEAIATLGQPLVLLLDDLHWADQCSIDLVILFLSKHIKGLFVVGTFDDGSKDCYFAQKLQEIQADGFTLTTICPVEALNRDRAKQLIGHALQSSQLELVDDLDSIADVLLKGTFFGLIEFLQWIHNNGLITFDDQTKSWNWDSLEIHRVLDDYPDAFFIDRTLERLPEETLDVLKVAACLGPEVNPTLLEYVLDFPIKAILADALSMHIFLVDEATNVYAFEHEKIQQAVYVMISNEKRELFHLEVGRRLLRRIEQEELDRNIFTVLSQMYIGKRLISRENERYATARLCLRAGQIAAKWSAFHLAAQYLNFGIELLGERAWRDEYDTTLAMCNAAAEMNMCAGNFDAIEPLVASVLKYSRSQDDQVQAQVTKIYSMGMRDRQSDALVHGLKVLSSLGVRFPRIKSQRTVGSEFKSVMKMLHGKNNRDLTDLPLVDDKTILACLQILNAEDLMVPYFENDWASY